MSKCSKCQNDFIHLLKSDGLPYKHCDRCRRTEKKYRDKHKEQKKNTEKLIKNIQKNMVFIIENLIKICLKKKQKNIVEKYKDNINAKNSERITCECGCTSRRDSMMKIYVIIIF